VNYLSQNIFAENEKIEAEFKSDVRSEIQRIIPNILLDGLNEMKVRDVLAKAVAVRTSLNFFSISFREYPKKHCKKFCSYLVFVSCFQSKYQTFLKSRCIY